MINPAWNKSQLYSNQKGDKATQFDQSEVINQQHGWKPRGKANVTHTEPPHCLPSSGFPKRNVHPGRILGLPSGRKGSGSWLMVGISCSLMFLFYCGRGERSSLLPSDWFRRHLILGLIARGRKNSGGTFGPWSELCVCPFPSVGDDTHFIIPVSHEIATYWEKSDYDLLLSEHPRLKVILALLSLFNCRYHH